MRLPAAFSTFVLISRLQVTLCQRPCHWPQAGRCSSSNYTIHSNEVYPLYAGTCDFTHSSGLCHYQQGCLDLHMTNWTQVGPANEKGRVQAKQHGTDNCGSEFYYSVLESPWLNINQESCLTFAYSRSTPAALDVFLEKQNGPVLYALERSDNPPFTEIKNEKVKVEPYTSKVIFRAYGGGGSNVANDGLANVYKVSVDSGLCKWPGNFHYTSSKNDDVWTSPLLSPTEPGTVDCLFFKHTLYNSAGSRLTVSVQPLGDNTTVTVWNNNAQGKGSRLGKCPFQVHAPYKIIFEAEKSRSTRQPSVKIIAFSRSVRGNACPLTPAKAATAVSNTVVTPSVINQPFRTLGMTSGVPPHTQGPDVGQDPKESDVAAIGGGVAAAVILIIIIAVIIIVIVVRRRRNLKKHDDNRTTTATFRGQDNDTANTGEQRHSDDYSTIRASHFAPSIPQEISSYPDLGGATSHPQHGDVDPYEPIPDGASGKTRPSSGEDDYNHIGISAGAASHGVVVDDDYHHIHSPHPAIPEPENSYANYPEHDRENNATQPVLGYTYTQVNKQRGGDRTMEVDPDSNNAYCKVNKKAKQKPGLAPKPAEPEGDGDPYNRIHRSSHPDQREQNVSEGDDVDDEYNRLNFDDPCNRDGGVN